MCTLVIRGNHCCSYSWFILDGLLQKGSLLEATTKMVLAHRLPPSSGSFSYRLGCMAAPTPSKSWRISGKLDPLSASSTLNSGMRMIWVYLFSPGFGRTTSLPRVKEAHWQTKIFSSLFVTSDLPEEGSPWSHKHHFLGSALSRRILWRPWSTSPWEASSIALTASPATCSLASMNLWRDS